MKNYELNLVFFMLLLSHLISSFSRKLVSHDLSVDSMFMVFFNRLRVVSNFGDSDCRVGEIRHARNFDARACVFRLPYNRHRQN